MKKYPEYLSFTAAWIGFTYYFWGAEGLMGIHQMFKFFVW